MSSHPKLRSAVHYIVSRCPPEDLGATKLNKILWFSDVAYYERFGESITRDEYVKRQFGPVPRNISSVLRDLEGARLIVSRETDYCGKPKKEFWALEEPDLTGFDARAGSSFSDSAGIPNRREQCDSLVV